MRRLLLTLALVAAWPGAAPARAAVDRPPHVAAARGPGAWEPHVAAARAPALWQPHVADARAFAQGRAGEVAFAVRTQRALAGLDADTAFQSASVVKAMLLVAYLRAAGVRARALRPSDRRLLGPMIRVSDDDAASRVRDMVGTPALTELARRAHMPAFVAGGDWGASLITARDQTRFFLRIDRLLPARHRAYAMELLRTITSSQRWGLGRVAPPGWTLYFKGGWGSGTGDLDHQVALLVRGRERVSVAVLTRNNPSHAYAAATLEGVFRRLLSGLAGVPAARWRPLRTERPRAPRRAPSCQRCGGSGYSAPGGSTAG